ncbi:hypothetical protein NDU88_003374 [Pleurodeles waltl]|uniref:Uncharacterized protein n=1 Tax=Pleurodeles waltl TaxID=8319 RepID=A0AAV7VFZ7_PLEWA|nr:hypothetical protein NDU88_003374 [Pleurodeles waltl]
MAVRHDRGGKVVPRREHTATRLRRGTLEQECPSINRRLVSLEGEADGNKARRPSKGRGIYFLIPGERTVATAPRTASRLAAERSRRSETEPNLRINTKVPTESPEFYVLLNYQFYVPISGSHLLCCRLTP